MTTVYLLMAQCEGPCDCSWEEVAGVFSSREKAEERRDRGLLAKKAWDEKRKEWMASGGVNSGVEIPNWSPDTLFRDRYEIEEATVQ